MSKVLNLLILSLAPRGGWLHYWCQWYYLKVFFSSTSLALIRPLLELKIKFLDFCQCLPSLNTANLTLREGNGTALQYSCLENPMDVGAWWAAVHGVAKSRTRLSDFPFTFQFHALEKEMATHSSVLAWRIPWMGEPGGLPSMGSHRVWQDWLKRLSSSSSLTLHLNC